MGKTKKNIFDVLNYFVIYTVALLCIYPFVYVLSASLSSAADLLNGEVLLWPKRIIWNSYAKILADQDIWMAYANSIFYTVAGTFVSILMTISGAYPLSKKRLIGRKFFTFMFVFTMWFNAGLIPFYLNMRDLNLLDSRMGIIIAFACTTFYIIILRTYFQGIPDSMEEAAKIDGANDFKILTTVYIPLSGPALSTIGLFYAVGRWNSYLWPMILLRDYSKMPLQVLLKRLIVEMNMSAEYNDVITNSLTGMVSKETIIYATIIISVVPMLALYPFIQRYFEKGIMIGALKG